MQRVEELWQRVDLAHSVPGEQVAVGSFGSGQRRGVGGDDVGPDVGLAGLYRDHGHSAVSGFQRCFAKCNRVDKALDMKPDGGDALIFEQPRDAVVDCDGRLIADGYHIRQRDAALLHGQVYCDVAALGNKRNTTLRAAVTELIGPQCGAG